MAGRGGMAGSASTGEPGGSPVATVDRTSHGVRQCYLAPGVPTGVRYFEDIEAGDVHEFGSYQLTKDEILEFGEKYDPQPFHTDEAAAEVSMFGGLIASGWQTAGICMRLLVDNYLSESASAGARGVRDLRWLEPVRPGDTITCRLEVLETEAANERTGNVVNRITGLVDGEPVIEWKGDAIFERRPNGRD